jgi:hypothetical protein
MEATITISGTMMALLIVGWYIGFRGEIQGRLRLVLFAFAAASLPWIGSLAQRFWQLIDTGIAAAQHARGVSTGLGMLLLSLGGPPW